MQTLATTRNIVWPNNVVSCCRMLAAVCKTLATSHNMLGLQMRIQRTLGRFPSPTPFEISCSHVFVWIRGMQCACAQRDILGCAVQTNATLLDHASMTAKQQKCWHLLALKFDQFQTSSNNFQQVATTRNNTQHGVQTLATTMLRLVGQQCCERLQHCRRKFIYQGNSLKQYTKWGFHVGWSCGAVEP